MSLWVEVSALRHVINPVAGWEKSRMGDADPRAAGKPQHIVCRQVIGIKGYTDTVQLATPSGIFSGRLILLGASRWSSTCCSAQHGSAAFHGDKAGSAFSASKQPHIDFDGRLRLIRESQCAEVIAALVFRSLKSVAEADFHPGLEAAGQTACRAIPRRCSSAIADEDFVPGRDAPRAPTPAMAMRIRVTRGFKTGLRILEDCPYLREIVTDRGQPCRGGIHQEQAHSALLYNSSSCDKRSLPRPFPAVFSLACSWSCPPR